LLVKSLPAYFGGQVCNQVRTYKLKKELLSVRNIEELRDFGLLVERGGQFETKEQKEGRNEEDIIAYF